MKYSFRKLAALSLALLLVFSALPVRAFAEGTLPKEEVVFRACASGYCKGQSQCDRCRQ